ncbi:MAG: nucleotide exchange factor GrpE [Candidatus Marinimicrobia bacterium]|nr:nucleotide exchange factor GrpE [Candidatus Neomarinimicrobiota bacterium]
MGNKEKKTEEKKNLQEKVNDSKNVNEKKIKPKKSQKVDKADKKLKNKIKKLEKKNIELEEKKLELENDVKKFKEKYILVHAEFENSKKRLEKELWRKVDLITKDIFLDIIHIVDDMDRAIVVEGNKKDVKESDGIKLVHNKMLKMLEKNNVTPFDSIGKEFDPDFHDAIMMKVDNEQDEDTIIEEFEKGYMLKKEVLRHSKVIVSKKEDEKK